MACTIHTPSHGRHGRGRDAWAGELGFFCLLGSLPRLYSNENHKTNEKCNSTFALEFRIAFIFSMSFICMSFCSNNKPCVENNHQIKRVPICVNCNERPRQKRE